MREVPQGSEYSIKQNYSTATDCSIGTGAVLEEMLQIQLITIYIYIFFFLRKTPQKLLEIPFFNLECTISKHKLVQIKAQRPKAPMNRSHLLLSIFLSCLRAFSQLQANFNVRRVEVRYATTSACVWDYRLYLTLISGHCGCSLARIQCNECNPK